MCCVMCMCVGKCTVGDVSSLNMCLECRVRLACSLPLSPALARGPGWGGGAVGGGALVFADRTAAGGRYHNEENIS